MPDLYLEDADTAAQVLDDRGYPELATTVRALIHRNDQMAELVDEAHDEIERMSSRRGGGRYWPTDKTMTLPALVADGAV